MFSLDNLIIHSFEPQSEKVVDDELIIDEETIWIPTCELGNPNAPKLPNDLYKKILAMYRVAEAKSKNPKECVECAVMNFRDELEMLDFMPLKEVLFDDTPDEPDTLDKDTEM